MVKLISESYVLTAVLLLLFSKSWNIVFAACNSCSVMTNLACTSQTQFQVCVDSLPTGTPTRCPLGYICSTTAPNICVPSDMSVYGDCTECNICDASQTFACTGVRTFALCLGTKVISNIGGNCASYHICNINYPYICGNESLGIAPTCPIADELATTVDSPTTTTASGSVIVTNPVAFCQTIQQNGRFSVGNELKTTCQQYVYCFIKGNVWSGAIYYCPSDTYFDTSSRYCSPVVPVRCVSSTQLLYLGASELSFDEVRGIERSSKNHSQL
uniref:Chitin-binding type-2 domain-containing protein n=1 Tax=Bactrocera dorsalis TaxID=27457 RepID=A0A034WJ83_BACDO